MKQLFAQSLNLLQFRRWPVTFLALALVGGAAWLGHGAQNYFRLLQVEQGLSTCHGRVLQSFMASRVAAVTKLYVRRDFLNLTQDCYSDVLGVVDDLSLSKDSNHLFVLMNSLVSKVYQFQRDLPQNGPDEKVTLERFGAIEDLKFSVMAGIEQMRTRLQQQLTPVASAVFMLFAFFALHWAVRWHHYRNTLDFRRALEQEAREELMNKSYPTSLRMDELLGRIFISEQLPLMARLFGKYHKHLIDHTVLTSAYREEPAAEATWSATVPSNDDIRTEVNLNTAEAVQAPIAVPANEQWDIVDSLTELINKNSHELFAKGVIAQIQAASGEMVCGCKRQIEGDLQKIFLQLVHHFSAADQLRVITLIVAEQSALVRFEVTTSLDALEGSADWALAVESRLAWDREHASLIYDLSERASEELPKAQPQPQSQLPASAVRPAPADPTITELQKRNFRLRDLIRGKKRDIQKVLEQSSTISS